MIYMSTTAAKSLLGGGFMKGARSPFAKLTTSRSQNVRRNTDGKFAKVKIDKAKMFRAAWDRHAGPDAPELTKEYTFAADIVYRDKRGSRRTRGWRFDFAIPDLMIAVEVDGNAWKTQGGGRHGTDKDREKMNEAAARGWLVFRFSPAQLKATKAEAAVEVVLRAVRARQESKRL